MILYFPAYLSVGMKSVEGLVYATILCLVPGLIVFLVTGYFLQEESYSVVAVSTLTRLMIAVLGALVILKLRPDFGLANFLIWLLICYFASLLVETLLFIR